MEKFNIVNLFKVKKYKLSTISRISQRQHRHYAYICRKEKIYYYNETCYFTTLA